MIKKISLFTLLVFNFCLTLTAGISKTVLVTGGAGYVGTQTCKALKEAGFHPVIYDMIPKEKKADVKWGTLVIGDISDRKRLCETIDKYHPIAIIHLAALKSVDESMREPAKYYLNNLSGSMQLLDVMREKGLKKIIFSSTAATYGHLSDDVPVKENHLCQPINPYGTSKWMVEKVIEDFKSAYGFEYVILRYFNVSGADLKGKCGEKSETASNLIPIVLQVASGKRKELEIFGRDHPTEDGTAIRDYIHVVDLADAHVKALEYLLLNKPSVTLNLGTGKGTSVQQIVETVKQVTKKEIPTKEAPRRAGDPSSVTADATLAKELLDWEPKHSDIKTIIESQWKWQRSLERSKTQTKHAHL